jgi:HK97 family phage portal protein
MFDFIKKALKQKAATVFNLESLFLTGREMPYTGGSNSPYSNSWIAYSCVRRLALDASGIPLVVLSDPEDPDSILPDTHPTAQMIAKPNPYFSQSEFIQWLITVLNISGEFFVVFDDPVRPTMMYQYTAPSSWHEITDQKDSSLLGWQYRHDGVQLAYETWEVMHHRFINPARVHRGMAPIEAAMRAYQIETGIDELAVDVINRGGEKSVLYTSEIEVTRQQRQQALEQLKGRRNQANRVAQDVLLPNGIKVVDPRFIEDDLKLLDAQKPQPDKIAAVYGLSKSLLGFEDIDKYATFKGRMRVYFNQTLIPMLKGVEDAFDSFFVDELGSKYHGYVRFDYRNVDALQENDGEQFQIAGNAHKDGIPWKALNQRFQLGLDLSLVPGNETILVQSTLAPIEGVIEAWNEPEPEPEPDEEEETGGSPASEPEDEQPADEGKRHELSAFPLSKNELTNALIRRRAANPRDQIHRHRALLAAERKLRSEWKKIMGTSMRKTERALLESHESFSLFKAKVREIQDATFDYQSEAIEKAHLQGAKIGSTSILDMIDGKMDDQTRSLYEKNYRFPPAILQMIRNRVKFIRDMNVDLFEDLLAAVETAIGSGIAQSEIVKLVRQNFHTSRGGINRALTIARTETGTAYNMSRFEEMKGQGFRKHTWLTAADELVRGEDSSSDFDHAQCNNQTVQVGDNFKCELAYPMEDGGEAGNVINCRCETIPYVSEEGYG